MQSREAAISQDPANSYEDEYWEEIGRQEVIDIKNLSKEPTRQFLRTYGDAIDERLDDTLAQSRYARQSGYLEDKTRKANT
jgi:hypothetical protein